MCVLGGGERRRAHVAMAMAVSVGVCDAGLLIFFSSQDGCCIPTDQAHQTLVNAIHDHNEEARAAQVSTCISCSVYQHTRL